MNLKEITQDEKHQETLNKTGFWGKAGAGCIIFCIENGKFLFPKRSRAVEQPGTYGTWGGAIDDNMSPVEAVRNEVKEEAGYNGQMKLIPLYVFQKNDFKYFNFLAIVKNEFVPKLNWETESYVWANIDNLPQPIHFGLKGIMDDEKSYNILRKVENRFKTQTQ